MLSTKEINTLTKKELFKELASANNEIQKIRLGVKTKHVKNSSLVVKQRRYVARLKTVIRQLELEEMVKKASTI